MLCGYWLPEDPVIYVSFGWDEGACVLGGEMFKARGVSEVG